MLPVEPTLKPMLAKLVSELPRGDFIYEPKWDGFRCLAFRDGDDVDLRSRHGRPLARYFPEVVTALLALDGPGFVLDGELVVMGQEAFDFPALMGRLHPAASRVELLSASTPALFVAFDVLATGSAVLCDRPFRERRSRLAALVGGAPSGIQLTPATDDPEVAEGWLRDFAGGGIDGVVAKQRDLPYRPGARAMTKVKHERTADCVVAGMRVFDDPWRVASLLLGLYDSEDELEHVGVATSFSGKRGVELLRELRPLLAPLAGHPWEHGFLKAGGPMGRLAGAAARWDPSMERDWIPLAPQQVVEVAYTQLDNARFRHPARFRRWRPDREPQSCRIDQLELRSLDPAAVLR